MSPATRAVAASTKAHSRRCASATAAKESSPGAAPLPGWAPLSAGPPACPGSGFTPAALIPVRCLPLREDHERPDLNAAEPRRAELGDVERVVQVARLDQVVAAQRLFGLDEGAVGHDVAADGRRGAGRLEGVAGDELAALLAHLLREAVMRLHDLLEHVWCRGGVALLVLIDQDQVFGHDGCPSGVLMGAITTPTIGAARDRHPPSDFVDGSAGPGRV